MSEVQPAAKVPAPIVLDLEWAGEMRFDGRCGETTVVMESDSERGLTPIQALAFGLAGCMAMDVVHILKKARLDLRGLRVHLSGERQADHPRRLVRAELGFRVEGDVPPDRVERAIALSRERYCTVWHSLRPDIELATRYEIARRA